MARDRTVIGKLPYFCSMMRFLVIGFSCLSFLASSQEFRSIMREQSEYYSSMHLSSEAQFDSLRKSENNDGFMQISAKTATPCVLNKKVLGWHPYWSGNAYNNYQWNLLSDLVYFDYSVSPSTGSNTNGSFAWNTASVITVAKNNNVKVHICATMFSAHSTFWGSVTAQNNFINTIVSLLNTRQGHGVNIDFEGMGATDKVPFTSFIGNLRTALNNANPNYQLSVCLYAVEWSSVFDIAALNNSVDFYTVMGYDYYYGGSPQAGPTSPLYNFAPSYNYTTPRSVTYYLKQGVPKSKLLLGLPYYGREWEVTGNTIPAATTGSFNASRTFAYINNTPATYTTSNKFWDNVSFSPYYKYLSGGNNRQCFVDDVYSLGRKYDMVNQRGIAGIGIWALGYDDGMTKYWDLIKDKFSSCAPVICSDSLYDMGGPARNYYDNEKYEYTLTAPSGSLVQLQFVSFGTENNYDSLWLYNGTSTLSPLIGAYTGTNSPGVVTSSAQALTLRFKSDGATVNFGFKAMRSCVPEPIFTSMANFNMTTGVLIFPNPASEYLYLEGEDLRAVEVYDVYGRKVIEEELLSKHNKISLQELGSSAGIYFVDVRYGSGNKFRIKLLYQP